MIFLKKKKKTYVIVTMQFLLSMSWSIKKSSKKTTFRNTNFPLWISLLQVKSLFLKLEDGTKTLEWTAHGTHSMAYVIWPTKWDSLKEEIFDWTNIMGCRAVSFTRSIPFCELWVKLNVRVFLSLNPPKFLFFELIQSLFSLG